MEDKEQQRYAKAHLVALMQRGYSYRKALALAGGQVSQSTAYRLLQAVRKRGEVALQDGRHGHHIKLRGEARAFLEEQCRQAPQTPSSAIQALLRERFGLNVSISQISRVRAALGISNRRKRQPQEKKRQGGVCFSSAEWQEGAGSLLFLAAAQQTDLLPALEKALSSHLRTADPVLRLAHSQSTTLSDGGVACHPYALRAGGWNGSPQAHCGGS